MMDQRQKDILRIALSYMLSNLDDIKDVFTDEDMDLDADEINYNGETMEIPGEDEIDELMKELQ